MTISPSLPHAHGGQLQVAAQQYTIPLKNWIDLSTGISPFVYPLPNVPEYCWQRLPEVNDGLITTASHYYGSPSLLAVAGSQQAIQSLPSFFAQSLRVGILKPAYHSHQHAWQKAGHQVISLSPSSIEEKLPTLDVLIIVNPCNPSTEKFSPKILRQWHQQLQQHKGTLIVDEAFIDSTPEMSLIQPMPVEGLIVLRSIGKFFGLAGVRLGFIWGEKKLLDQIEKLQDDWSVSHPARWAGKIALADTQWQQNQQKQLQSNALRLKKILEKYLSVEVKSTTLFCYLQHDHAELIHQQLAQQGILTRLFNKPAALRFGLPTPQQWQRLETALCF